MTIQWDTSLSVGVDSIDDDHKKLLNIINAFGSDDEKSREELTVLIDELLDYTRYHFEREEEMMAENGYYQLEEHKQEHGQFIKKLMELGIMLDTEDVEQTRKETSQFLSMWLSRHIRWSDMNYVSCLILADKAKAQA
ncbi:MAG: bacteriohemerythrin [Magnetovibrio sp.]|nr:bacteriohemerythrin [Magnetovibrio sp.]